VALQQKDLLKQLLMIPELEAKFGQGGLKTTTSMKLL